MAAAMRRASFLRRLGGAFVLAATASLFEIEAVEPYGRSVMEMVCPRCNGKGVITYISAYPAGVSVTVTNGYLPEISEEMYVCKPCPACRPATGPYRGTPVVMSIPTFRAYKKAFSVRFV